VTPRRETLADAAVVGALAVFAALLRAGEVGQSSLWLDDAWVALAHKADGLHEFLLAGLTAPGFAALFKAWSAVVGFSTTKAQVLPFLLGTVTAPALYAVLVRRGLGRVAAAAGAFLLAVSTLHVAYSARVKQYTLDALVVVAFLAAAWWVLERRDDRRRWWVLAGVSVAAAVLSSAAIVFVVSGIVIAILALWRAHGRGAVRVALVPCAVVAAFLAGWWVLVLRPATNPELQDFFAGRYVTVDEGPVTAVREAGQAIRRVVEEAIAFPVGIALSLAFAAAVVVLWRRPALGCLLLVPIGAALVLAALQTVPLGTGRTDIYLYPALAMLVAVALDEVGRLFLPAAVAVVLALGLLWAVSRESPRGYPHEDIAPLVRQLEAQALPGDAILIYPHSNFAYGVYTTYPIELVESRNYATGFQVRVERANVFLPDPHWRDPAMYRLTIERIAQDTVWFVATHSRKDVPKIEELLRARGYERDFVWRRPGAELSRWSRTG
jgi:4-amino-4-deoxy-L-arabinose transferase-like glycosyltransferase